MDIRFTAAAHLRAGDVFWLPKSESDQRHYLAMRVYTTGSLVNVDVSTDELTTESLTFSPYQDLRLPVKYPTGVDA